MKKRLRIKLNCKLLLLAFFTSSSLYGQQFNQSFHIEKAFKLNPYGTVEVTNKYGRVQVVIWEKDSVKLNIDYAIRTDNAETLTKIKNSIDFNFVSTSEYYVFGKTNFINNNNGIIKEIISIAKNLLDDSQVEINYTVMLPRGATVKINNKYGDVYLDDITGSANITLSNGDFKTNSLTSNTLLDLSFGNATINTIKSGKITLNYAGLEITKAEDLNIESKSSKIILDDLQTLKIRSKRDNIKVSRVNNVYGDAYFSEIYIYELGKEISISPKFGNLNVESISNRFSLINLDSEYTDIELFIEHGATYQLDITHSKDVVLKLPHSVTNLEKKPVDATQTQFVTYGTIGSGQSLSKLQISATKKCSISIHQK